MEVENRDNFLEIFDKIEQALINSKILKEFDARVYSYGDVNYESITLLLSTPCELYIDEELNRLYTYDGNNDKIYCPEPEESVLYSAEWLEEKLPTPTFSFDQGGNIRKAEEAEAIYQVIVTSRIFDNMLEEDIDKILKSGYDFDTLIGKPQLTFLDLLRKIQDLQSVYINAVLSACQIKISNLKKRLENFFVDMLTQEEITKLGEIDLKRKEVNVRMEKLGKGTKDLHNKSKIQILEIINEREDSYNKIFQEYPYYSKLWKIRNLSSEYIPTITKAKIRRVCEKELNAAMNANVISREEWQYKDYLRRSIRRAYKAVLVNIKEKEIAKCQNNRDTYTPPLKR